MPDADGPAGTGCDLLIVGAHVVTMDERRTVYPSGAVAIAGPEIVAAGPEREVSASYRAARVLDARGAVVHPGFVESHYHAT
jgi:5-methylthioadenosine/S-adenosylhomocysteine deaminase